MHDLWLGHVFCLDIWLGGGGGGEGALKWLQPAGENGGDWETRRSITFHTSHNTEDIAILTHTASIQTFIVYCKKNHMEGKKGLELEHISIQLLHP